MKPKKRGYWTLERLIKSAKKYPNKTAFRKGNPKAYGAAMKQPNKSKIFAHMPNRKKVSPVVWSESKLKNVTRNIKYLSDFKTNYSGAVKAAKKHGLYEELTKHMIKKKLSWTKNKAVIEAKKYNKISEFRADFPGAYNYIREQSLEDKAYSHMLSRKKWDEKAIIKEAKKYKYRSQFIKNAGAAYSAARRLGILAQSCKHMKKKGNRYKRALYAFEFPDRSVYVGLTYDYESRYKYHLKNNKLLKTKTDQIGHTFIMFNEYFNKDTVGAKEQKLIESYRKKGWTILNRAKAGALGATERKWTKVTILEAVKKCRTISEFRKKYPGAYTLAGKYKLKKYLHKVLDLPRKPKDYWRDKNKIMKVAKKYKYASSFKREQNSAYIAARKMGILDEVCQHMKIKKIPGRPPKKD